MDILTTFKKKAATALFSEDDPNPMFLVAVKHTGKICVLCSNDPEMSVVIPLMIAGRNPHFVWREFAVQKEALEHKSQLKSFELADLIPMDPMKAKAAR